jgi:hypothetical protein
LLIPLPLALPVSFRPRRILLAQLHPVVRMLGAPLLGAVQTHLPIHRIAGDLAPMVVVAALPLARRITASGLSWLKLGWLKGTLAIAANPFFHEPVLACQCGRMPSANSLRQSI